MKKKVVTHLPCKISWLFPSALPESHVMWINLRLEVMNRWFWYMDLDHDHVFNLEVRNAVPMTVDKAWHSGINFKLRGFSNRTIPSPIDFGIARLSAADAELTPQYNLIENSCQHVELVRLSFGPVLFYFARQTDIGRDGLYYAP